MPQFVTMWITYGLPVSALVMGALFYVMLRLDPDAARADDEAELQEKFARIKHNARLEVMASPQMKAVIRQMTWQQLPPVVGRQMNLTEAQIAALTRQAPQLLDLNGDGIPDIEARQNTYDTPQVTPLAHPVPGQGKPNGPMPKQVSGAPRDFR